MGLFAFQRARKNAKKKKAAAGKSLKAETLPPIHPDDEIPKEVTDETAQKLVESGEATVPAEAVVKPLTKAQKAAAAKAAKAQNK